MVPTDAQLARIQRDDPADALAPDVALQFLRESRRDAGGAGLFAAAASLAATIGFAGAGIEIAAKYFLFAAVAAVATVFFCKRGLGPAQFARALLEADTLRNPTRAALIDGVVIVGAVHARRSDWRAIPVTPAQQAKLRILALPAARAL